MDSAHPGRRTALLTLGLLVVLAACGGIKPKPGNPSASRKYTVTSEEMAATGALTVWEWLRVGLRFTTITTDSGGRPARIETRGRSSLVMLDKMLVFLDRVPVADIRFLADLRITEVEGIQILSGLDATTYFGTNAGEGIISIFTRNR